MVAEPLIKQKLGLNVGIFHQPKGSLSLQLADTSLKGALRWLEGPTVG